MKISIKVYVYYQKYAWDSEGRFVAFSLKINSDSSNTFICEQDVSIEIPDSFNIGEQQIATLLKQKEKISQEYSSEIEKLNHEIDLIKSGGVNV